jgi:hypothetical protein
MQGLLLVPSVSFARLVLRLLYPILLFMRPRYLAILLRYPVVILRGPFSTYTLEGIVMERRGQEAGVERIGHEAKGK